MNAHTKFLEIQDLANHSTHDQRAELLAARQAESLRRSMVDGSVMQYRTRCPSCLSSSLSLVYEEPYASAGVQDYLKRHYENRASKTADGYVYALVCCDGCGLTFQQNVPSEKFLGEIYNGWVPGTELERTHRNYSLQDYRYLAEQVQFVNQYFGLSPNEISVLDFGFGWAHWSKMAMGYGFDVSGVELSEERIKHGQSLGLKIINLADLPAKKFRFINTEQVFEHLIEPRAVLERLVESLSPDGLIKISVPNASNSLKKIKRSKSFAALSAENQMPIAPLEHLNSFSSDSLIAFGKNMGLKPMRPSFYQLYSCASGLLQPKNFARILARHVYRNVYPRSTFIYFERA
jgi:2-polyprenyl-3-methyl-5-hydroxy-6-metoxy-1,4-benzoquinol methylase